MGIRFEYQPLVAGAGAAFFTGRGRAQERQRKYNLDLLQRQQALAMRQMERQQDMDFRLGLENRRNDQWWRRNVAQQDAIDQRQSRQLDATQARFGDLRDSRSREAAAANLWKVYNANKDRLTPEQQGKLAAEIGDVTNEMQNPKVVDVNDPEQEQQLGQRVDSLMERMVATPEEPDPNIHGWIEKEGGGFRRPVEGEFATHEGPPGTVPVPTERHKEALAKEAEVQERQRDDRFKYADALSARISRLVDAAQKKIDDGDAAEIDFEKIKQQAITELTSAYEAAGIPVPGQVVQQGAGNGVEAPAAAEAMTPEEFNAKWETLKPGDTLRGPDGVLYTKQG